MSSRKKIQLVDVSIRIIKPYDNDVLGLFAARQVEYQRVQPPVEARPQGSPRRHGAQPPPSGFTRTGRRTWNMTQPSSWNLPWSLAHTYRIVPCRQNWPPRFYCNGTLIKLTTLCNWIHKRKKLFRQPESYLTSQKSYFAIFRGIQPSIQGCASHFMKEFAMAMLRAKKDQPNIWIYG